MIERNVDRLMKKRPDGAFNSPNFPNEIKCFKAVDIGVRGRVSIVGLLLGHLFIQIYCNSIT